MITLFSTTPSPQDKTQSRLFSYAALFLFLYALVLTLSPAVRLHSWAVSYRWEQWIGFAVWLGGFIWIHHETLKYLPTRDPYILPTAGILTGWGLLTIYRLNPAFGYRQTIWLAACLLIFWLGMKTPDVLRILRRYKYLALISGLLLTALTLFMGTYPSGDGPSLWLQFWGIYIQPSEPLKLLLVIFLAAYLADQLPMNFNLIQLITPTLVLIGAALAVLFAQRDLGAASLFILLYFLMLYLAVGKRRVLVFAAGFLLLSGIVGYGYFDVIRLRVDAWVTPWLDPAGRSYQIVQSLLAIGSGGVLGKGPGIGSPGLVPVALSDFVFASIAEEMGLLGAVAVLILVGILALRGFLTALHAHNSYRRFLAAGIALFFAVQSILIIGGNIRFLPLTGVTLPFVSYGGSSLLTSFIGLLFLLLISAEPEIEQTPNPRVDPRPYQLLGGIILACMAVMALITGWWAVVRSNSLMERADNARPSISERYVQRGSILSRDNTPLATTIGEPGSYTRQYSLPALSPIIGYTQPMYGRAGLEEGLNDYLQGTRGNPSSTIWYNQIIYGQLPPGRDVRLSLDNQVQQNADDLLAGHTGALVLLNASSGEILAMSSFPYFDANTLAENWESLVQDENSPLLNRAVQGTYPLGTAIGPFLLAENEERSLPRRPEETAVEFEGQSWDCAIAQPETSTWSSLIRGGCPGALTALSSRFTLAEIRELYLKAAFNQTPEIPLPSAQAVNPMPEFEDKTRALLGQEAVSITPLQAALAAASLSTGEGIPAPRIAVGVNIPDQGWVVIANGPTQPAISANSPSAVNLLADTNTPTWHTVGTAWASDRQITWYIGGTLAEWSGTPLAMAVVLEENNPQAALQIGSSLFRSTLLP